MKWILLLCAFLLASYFEAVTGQEDYDRSLEQFLNKSLLGFPDWLKEKGYTPDILYGYGNFTLISEDQQNEETIYNLTGEITNRFYYGYEKNIRALSIQSNLSYYQFYFDLAYGDGENDFIEGKYSLRGKVRRTAVNATGKYRRTGQIRDQLHEELICYIGVTDDGYFDIIAYQQFAYLPKFDTFTLDDLNWAGAPWQLTPVVESWYMGQFSSDDSPDISWYWVTFMNEVFATNPIADIIGTTLAPTVSASPRKLEKSVTYSREPYFNKEKNKWGIKSSYSYYSA